MTYGIIDIGSNTIRLNIYKIEGRKFELLMSKKESAGLVQYVKKGQMTKEGIEVLAECLERFKELMKLLHIDGFSSFATASLRNIDNSQTVIDIIKQRCNIEIDLLSGEEEGIISFHGALHGLRYDHGIYIDSGGGSSEILSYDQSKVFFSKSLPVGSLNLFNKYVKNIFPDVQEVKLIRERIEKELEKTVDSKKCRCDVISVTGGSMRAVRTLLVKMNYIDESTFEIKSSMLSDLVKKLMEDPEKTVHLFLKVKPDRVHTLMPGLLIIETIAKYTKSKKVQVSMYGIREGYLLDKIIGG
ncbi:hypothetical protein [uncultured Faecalicoccus sp.]|uniref:Ppx/GppA phosphatase family protein n=1 Tax=uncultured Faecalicoccus sp. TaxID=1971760 RepID=UPI00261CA816|nr:hypothetical protein [uncultured Faecalicoccus sp.]